MDAPDGSAVIIEHELLSGIVVFGGYVIKLSLPREYVITLSFHLSSVLSLSLPLLIIDTGTPSFRITTPNTCCTICVAFSSTPKYFPACRNLLEASIHLHLRTL